MFSHCSSFALTAILWAIHGVIIEVYEEDLEYSMTLVSAKFCWSSTAGVGTNL